MKILFCEAFDDGTVGGSHACMFALVSRLDRARFDVTVSFAGPNPYVARFEKIGIPVHLLPPRDPVRGGFLLIRKARNWWRLVRGLEAELADVITKTQADLVVVNNSVYVARPYIRAARRCRVPIAVYERGIGRFGAAHARASQQVSAGIPVSAAVASYLAQRGYDPQRNETIYDGIDPGRFSRADDAQQIKLALGLPADAVVMGILGNLRPWKGQRVFVEAFIELAGARPELHGVIIGGTSPADQAYAAEVRTVAQESGFGDRLHFLGYRQDAAELLGMLDLFVHASVRAEPFGMVLLEAMASGCPVVASDSGGPREIVAPGTGLLAAPGEPVAVAQACARFLDDVDFRRTTVERARSHVEDSFRIETTVSRTAALFEEIVAANNRV